MIIAGAGAAGKETLGLLLTSGQPDYDVVFFDENPNAEKLIFEEYKVLKNLEDLQNAIKKDPFFCVAIGNPRRREKLFNRLLQLGGIPKNVYPQKGIISITTINTLEENGSIFQVYITTSFQVETGKSCFVHSNSTLGHQVKLGDFVNVGPNCSLIGPLTIGNYTYIGAGSTILPNISIGNNVFISPGSVVNRSLKDFETF